MMRTARRRRRQRVDGRRRGAEGGGVDHDVAGPEIIGVDLALAAIAAR
jgi:hypothetical protein